MDQRRPPRPGGPAPSNRDRRTTANRDLNRPRGRRTGHPTPKVGDDGEDRLQKVLAHAGIGSRRSCEELILKGRVSVDGKIIRELGTKVDLARSTVAVDGEPVKAEKHVYYAVYKPKGYVSTTEDPAGRPRVLDILPNLPQRVYTVGRLDEMSVGLILITNDGVLAHKLAHPKYGVEKLYRVVVAGSPGREVLNQLTEGIWLAEGKVRAKKVRAMGKRGDSTILEMVLSEGKNREVRRMLAKLGHKVMSLARVAVGPISIKGLSPGHYRSLTPREVTLLRKAANGEFVSNFGRPMRPVPAPAPVGTERPRMGARPPMGQGPADRAPSGRPMAGGRPTGTGNFAGGRPGAERRVFARPQEGRPSGPGSGSRPPQGRPGINQSQRPGDGGPSGPPRRPFVAGGRPEGQGDRPQRPMGNRPQGPGGDRSQASMGGMPQGPGGYMPQRPAGNRPQGPGGYRSQAPMGDRPQGPMAGRPQGPGGGRPQGRDERSQAPMGGRPQGPGGDRPQGPMGGRPQGPGHGRPQGRDERPQGPGVGRPQGRDDQRSQQRPAGPTSRPVTPPRPELGGRAPRPGSFQARPARVDTSNMDADRLISPSGNDSGGRSRRVIGLDLGPAPAPEAPRPRPMPGGKRVQPKPRPQRKPPAGLKPRRRRDG